LDDSLKSLTFTFIHLPDAFIQSDFHCICTHSYQFLLSLGIESMTLVLQLASNNSLLFELQESYSLSHLFVNGCFYIFDSIKKNQFI